MNAPLVLAEDLHKSFPLVYRRDARLRALARLLFTRSKPEAVEILRGIDLRIERGQSLAIIGENGAGKSTLLKLLTGVLTPTRGRIAVNGRIGALLELGAGFHPEYSGRENLRMAAAIAGLSPAELKAKLPEIIAFADIGRYIDEPIKHYSSGMVVRLGFAVVSALRPDLLITDEVLAVGDESFQKKCTAWMEDYLSAGGTLLLVSHSMYHVQKLCRQAIWLNGGAIEQSGDVFTVSQAYLGYLARKTDQQEMRASRALTDFTVESWQVNGQTRMHATTLSGAERRLRIVADVHSRDGDRPHLHVGMARADGTPIYGVGSDMGADYVPEAIGNGCWRFRLDMDLRDLLPGSYRLRLHALDQTALRMFDTVELELNVAGASREFGVYRVPHRWHHDRG